MGLVCPYSVLYYIHARDEHINMLLAQARDGISKAQALVGDRRRRRSSGIAHAKSVHPAWCLKGWFGILAACSIYKECLSVYLQVSVANGTCCFVPNAESVHKQRTSNFFTLKTTLKEEHNLLLKGNRLFGGTPPRNMPVWKLVASRRRCVPEDNTLHNHRYDNRLKSCNIKRLATGLINFMLSKDQNLYNSGLVSFWSSGLT